jgi:hypothetical protein
MTRAENWQLALRICEESSDEVIASLRIALLDDFGKTDRYSKGDNFRQLAVCLKSFLPFRRKAAISQAPQGRPMILIPAISGSNLLNLLPVAQEARRRGLLGGIVAGESFQKTRSTALGEFEHVVSETVLRSLVGMGFLPKSLARAGRRLKRLIVGLNNYSPHCAKRVKQNFGSYIRLMVVSEGMSIAYRQLFSMWRPSFMISTSDFWPAEFQCCWQAKRLEIPTAIVQHGVINDVCAWPTYYDTFLAWGDTFREQLLRQGAPAERIRVVGMPASDDLFLRTGQKADRVKNGMNPSCLVFSHTQDRIEEVALFEDFGRCLVEAIRSTPEVKWRIRLHPAEDDSFYRELEISRFKNVEISPRDISLEQAVEEASVVCTIRSTAGLQAMMLQKPLIVLNLASLSGPPVAWPIHGGGLYAKNADEFVKNLARLTSDGNFRCSLLASQSAFLDKTFANRGRAAAAIVDYLEEQTSARNT